MTIIVTSLCLLVFAAIVRLRWVNSDDYCHYRQQYRCYCKADTYQVLATLATLARCLLYS